jgi:23S rRNA (uracil1939-C5)-methyltransferase
MSRRRKGREPGPADALPVDRGDRFEAVLGEFDDHGETTAAYQGVPVSVSGGICGERVVVEIVRKYPDRLACRVVEVLAPDADRVAAPCPYVDECTGCQFQHVAYARQLEIKRARVVRALDLVTALDGAQAAVQAQPLRHVEVRPTVPSPVQFAYRNHARLTIGKGGEAGFVNRHTRRFLRVGECLLMAPAINRALAGVQGRLGGMTQMSVRAGLRTGDVLVQPALPIPAGESGSGRTHYRESVAGREFRIAGSSFFQVNVAVAELVVDLVAEALRLSGRERVVDAYAGVGVFATLLAGRAREVIGIEDSASAVDDARVSAAGLANVRFELGRTELALGTLSDVDAVVLDPPRAGCHPAAIAALRALNPASVAMVSCEPDAMARDLALTCEGGRYVVDWVQPVDMFPQTYHVECVAALRRAS